MKLIFVLLLSVSSAYAGVCEKLGGVSAEYLVAYNTSFTLRACQFDKAVIDISTLTRYRIEQRSQLVIDRYLANENLWPKDCYSSGGGSILTYSADGDPVHFCRYLDGSMMEYQTFGRGLKSKENRAMEKALKLRKPFQ